MTGGRRVALLEITGATARTDSALTVVLCGSFRRDAEGLAVTFSELQSHFVVLSPRGLNFIDPAADFVRLPNESGAPVRDVEALHLEAMNSADFVWLHAPDGYVGTSAAMELGHAAALGISVFASVLPSDQVLASLVHIVRAPSDVTDEVLEAVTKPGRGVSRLQQYYETTARRRGWSDESADETLARLAGEVAELSEAIRRADAGIRAEEDRDADVAGELADVQLYLVHLANALGLDLADAVTAKERVNARRFGRPCDAALRPGAKASWGVGTSTWLVALQPRRPSGCRSSCEPRWRKRALGSRPTPGAVGAAPRTPLASGWALRLLRVRGTALPGHHP